MTLRNELNIYLRWTGSILRTIKILIPRSNRHKSALIVNMITLVFKDLGH